jgi:hypothetical protein
MARLRQRASQWLYRLEEAQRELTLARSPIEPDRLAERVSRIEERLARLRVRIARHPARLRPRPAAVQEALAGYVASVGNTRFRRIAREIAIFEQRVRTGGHALRQTFTDQMPGEVAQLLTDVEEHLASPPPSTRAHGLSAAERTQRERRAADFHARAEELLSRVRGHFRMLFSFPLANPVGEAVLNWLADTEDLYELGVLRRKGVFGGLGRRHGWRLERLLRVS